MYIKVCKQSSCSIIFLSDNKERIQQKNMSITTKIITILKDLLSPMRAIFGTSGVKFNWFPIEKISNFGFRLNIRCKYIVFEKFGSIQIKWQKVGTETGWRQTFNSISQSFSRIRFIMCVVGRYYIKKNIESTNSGCL